VLDGAKRGLVAVDPSPCLGDAAFDAVDLVFWRAEDGAAIASRSDALATAIGADPERLLAWCAVFAGMVALELAESSRGTPKLLDSLVALAAGV